jgi:hypothetical protein
MLVVVVAKVVAMCVWIHGMACVCVWIGTPREFVYDVYVCIRFSTEPKGLRRLFVWLLGGEREEESGCDEMRVGHWSEQGITCIK